MSLRRAALATTAALTAALLAPVMSAQASTPLKATYTCTINSMWVPNAEPFAMDVNAAVSAVRVGAVVELQMTMEKPVLPLDNEFEATLSSSLKASANGAATTLTGSGTVLLKPNTPVDLPALKSSVTTPAGSMTLSPGPLTVKVTTSGVTIAINCTPNSTTSITLAVSDPNTIPQPAPTPVVKKAPVLKVSLTKKTQKFKAAPVRVKVRLGRAAETSSEPRGSIVVKVGARKVSTRVVNGPKNFTIVLPRNLRVGTHKVSATFNPTRGNDYLKVTRTVKLRVTR